MSDQWYYMVFGESFGPVSRSELEALIEIGTLSSEDRVSCGSESDWQHVSETPEFAQIASESLDFADSFDDFNIDFDSGGSEQEPPVAESNVAVLQQATADSSGPENKPKPPVATGDSPRRNGFEVRLHKDGAEYYSADAVRSLILVGAINGRTPIRKLSTDPWSTVRELIPDEYAKYARSDTGRQTANRRPRNRRARSPHAARLAEMRRRDREAEDKLAEIFDEMEVQQKSTPTPRESASVPVGQTPTSAPVADWNHPGPTTQPAPAFAALAAATPKPATATQYHKPKKRRQPAFQMPEGRSLAMAGGGAVSVLLVLALYLGWIALPFGAFGGALDGDRGVVVHCFLEYRNLAGMPDQVEWDHFVTLINTDVKPIAESSGSSDAPVAQAAALLMEIAESHPVKDRQKIAAAGQKLSPLVGEIAGS